MKNLIFIIVIGALASSCSKNRNTVPVEHLKVIGDYEWSFSDLGQESKYSDETEEEYGLRIFENQKIIFYQDSKKQEKLIITDYDIDSYNAVTTISLSNSGKMYFFEKELRVVDFPFEGNFNYFYKHEN